MLYSHQGQSHPQSCHLHLFTNKATTEHIILISNCFFLVYFILQIVIQCSIKSGVVIGISPAQQAVALKCLNEVQYSCLDKLG